MKILDKIIAMQLAILIAFSGVAANAQSRKMQTSDVEAVLPPATNAHTWVAYGDSISALASSGSQGGFGCFAGTLTTKCQGYLTGSYATWLDFYTGQRVYRQPGAISGNCGVGGYLAAQILGNISCVLALKPSYVVLEDGANDAASNTTCAAFVATDRQIISTLLANGIAVFQFGVYPRISPAAYSPSQANLAQCYNQYRRYYAQENPNSGYYFVDIENIAVDPTQSTWASPTGFLQADGVHPSKVGGSAIGWALAQVINSVFPYTVVPLFSQADIYDATNNPLGNLLPNGTLIGTSGTVSAPCTGTAATGLLINQQGTQSGVTCVASVTTTADGRPQQVVTLSGASYTSSGGAPVAITQAVSALSAIAANDVLEGGACVNIGANTNIAGIDVRLLTTEGGQVYQSSSSIPDPTGLFSLPMPSAGWATGKEVCVKTPRRLMTATPSAVQLVVYTFEIPQASASTIAATVTVTSEYVRKVLN